MLLRPCLPKQQACLVLYRLPRMTDITPAWIVLLLGHHVSVRWAVVALFTVGQYLRLLQPGAETLYVAASS